MHGPEIAEELAGVYSSTGNLEGAAVTYMESLALNPDRPGLAPKLVDVYRRLDPAGCSLANGGLNLGCPLVRGHLCGAARNLTEMYRKDQRDATAETMESQAVRNFGCPVEMFHTAAR